MDSHADIIQNEFHATPDKVKFAHRYPLKWNLLCLNRIKAPNSNWKEKKFEIYKRFRLDSIKF
jgi:hypothetical protein